MDSYATKKLSLLAEYDDICRHLCVLTSGCEKEFKLFIETQKAICLKVKDLELENKRLQKRTDSLETDKLRFETQLKHARNLLIKENEKNTKLELEKNSLARQIALIKELLADGNGIDNQTKERLVQLSSIYNQQNDLVRLTTIEESGSLLSSSDCDETNDDLNEYKNNKSKHFSEDVLVRNKKSEGSVFFTFDDECTDNDVLPRKSMVTFRSSSEPNSTSPEEPVYRQIIRSDSEVKVHASEVKQNSIKKGRSSLPTGRYSNGGKLRRAHSFVLKTFIRAEKCHPCGKIIKFCKQALKCTDCRISCHTDCKDQCPLPCIPVVPATAKKQLETIADYCSSTSPMIPSLIVHCVNEIESRGLQDIGLYRVPGSEREVKELKEKFLKGKTVPPLNEIDVHVICGTMKEFLRSLKDSLIPKNAWLTFAMALDHPGEYTRLRLLFDAVCELPQPNKETLAFLVIHLQRVAESPLCKMPAENLAKVFGPTVVGYSADDSDIDVLMETKVQNKVMEDLLKIPPESWQNLFSVENNIISSELTKTPESLPAPVTSRLGPIYPSSQKPKNLNSVLKTTLAPRSARPGKNGKKIYFSSPIMK